MHGSAAVFGASGAIVIMYHSVAAAPEATWIDPRFHVSPRVFERQMEFLATRKNVVSLPDVVSVLVEGKPLPDRAVAITFDDAYLDTLTVAAPILERYGLSATVFVPTGYVDQHQTQWVDQLHQYFRFRSRHSLVLDPPGEDDEPWCFDLSDGDAAGASYEVLCARLLAESPEGRRTLLSGVHHQLRPAFRTAPRLTMGWEDLRRLLNEYPGFDVGSHGVNHRDLTALGRYEVADELVTSRRRIAEELDVSADFVSACYNRTSPMVRRLFAENGFLAGFGRCSFDPVIRDGVDRYNLPRVEVSPAMRSFPLEVCAANRGIWRWMGHEHNHGSMRNRR